MFSNKDGSLRTSKRFLPLLAGVMLILVLASCRDYLPPYGTSAEEVSLAEMTPTPSPVPTNTPTPTRTPTPTVTPTPTAAQRLLSTATATPGRVEITLTEAEINDLAQKAIGQQENVPISNVYVDLRPDRIVFGGLARVGFFNVNVEIEASVSVQACRPEPQIEVVRVNGEAVGGFMRTQIDAMITPYLQQFAQADLNVCVEEVEISERALRMTGRMR